MGLDDYQIPWSNGLSFLIRPTDGSIICLGCNLQWCEHMGEFVKNNGDTGLIFRPRSSWPVSGEPLQIPVIPSRNLWDTVYLDMDDDRMARVLWNKPTRNLTGAIVRDPDHLTFLTPGEGRNVIRETLIQQMWTVPSDQLECRSSSHGFNEQMRWESNLTNVTAKYAEFWSVYTTAVCISCSIKIAGASTADLVPDKEGNVWA